MATGLGLSACGGAAGIVIPDSLKAPCETTVNLEGATVLGDFSNAVIQGDGDLRVCSVKKDAVIAIAESGRRSWWPF